MAEQRNIPADLVEIGTLARSPRHPWRNPRQLLCRLVGAPARGCGVSSGREQASQKDGDRHRPYASGDAADPVCRGPDRTAAEFLRGQTLLIPESALPELDEDEVYLHDMLGLSVVLDATGQKLGSAGSRPFPRRAGTLVHPHAGRQGNPASRRARICRGPRSRYRDHPHHPSEGLLELYM